MAIVDGHFVPVQKPEMGAVSFTFSFAPFSEMVKFCQKSIGELCR